MAAGSDRDLSASLAELIDQHGFDAVSDEMAKQHRLLSRSADGNLVLHRPPGISDDEWRDIIGYARVTASAELNKFLETRGSK